MVRNQVGGRRVESIQIDQVGGLSFLDWHRKKMDYYLDDAMRQIPGKVTSNCNFSSFTTVLDLLDEEHASILRRSCLWSLHELSRIQFSGQIMDALLCRLLKPDDEDSLRFDLGGKVVTFSISQFAFITELKCTDKEAALARISRNSRLLHAYFEGRTPVSLAQLEKAFRECDQMSDKLKLSLVFILKRVLRCHHGKTLIDVFHLEVVNEIDTFNNYPWGQRCFVDTLRIFRSAFSMPKGDRPERKYDAYGLPLALQLWVYETVPILADRFAIRLETRCPRMLHWRAQYKPLAKQISALLDDLNLEILAELTPSIEEEDQRYTRGLFTRATPDDQSPEPDVDADMEHGPVDRRSSPPSIRSPPPLRELPPPSMPIGSPPSSMPMPSPPLPMPMPMPMSSPPSMRSHSPPSRHSSRASQVHVDLYVVLFAFMVEIRGEIREEVGALRAEIRGEVGALRGEIGGEVGALRGEVGVLRGQIGALQKDVEAL